MNLNISNLTKRFGRFTAVHNVSLTVNPGECYALIGPNGAGKTTLIKCMLGFYRWYAGNISAGSKPIRQAMKQQLVGYLPERLAFPPLISGLGYLESQADNRGLSWEKLNQQRCLWLRNSS